jgi:hypothetical protein
LIGNEGDIWASEAAEAPYSLGKLIDWKPGFQEYIIFLLSKHSLLAREIN